MSAAARLSVRLLEKFNSWFTSAAGVWQTFAVTLGLVVIEFLNPRLDEHGFWLLYWMTLYSAATQPALAYVAAKAAEKTDEDLRRDEEILTRIDNLISERLGDIEARKETSSPHCQAKAEDLPEH